MTPGCPAGDSAVSWNGRNPSRRKMRVSGTVGKNVLTSVVAAAALVLALTCVTTAEASAPRPTGGAASERDWGTCAAAEESPAKNWYLAEGCTAGGFETWVVVQNPGAVTADIQMDFQTGAGAVAGPRDAVAPLSRSTYNVSEFVTSYNVSTTVTSSSGVVCERSMYGNGREWGTGAAGVSELSGTWYLAEGCTAGSFETWVVVQNPGDSPVDVTMRLQTEEGEVDGPADSIPGGTRRSYNLAGYVVSDSVSTVVSASGEIACERAMYGGGREWGTASAGRTAPSTTWYMAEGCTLPGFETWVVVQNPGTVPAEIGISLLTDSGELGGPSDIVPAGRRRTYDISAFAPRENVSSVVAASAPVVVERAVYGGDRLWGTCSSGSTELSNIWSLAEGCTGKGFETWLCVVNPGEDAVSVDVMLETEAGPATGPSGVLGPGRRLTFNLGDSVTSYEVASVVHASGPVACERAMYGEGTNRRPLAPVDGPLLYPFTRDASIACGHWPAGSTDYPYFGAPRAGTRLHAGIDIYPAAGAGAPVRAMKAGTVVRTGLFYTRYTGEQTFAVLVDHGDFVANYAELRPLGAWVQPGAGVARGQVIGYVSGTVQLHFEMYTPGTTGWLSWYGPQPANLIDPTAMMLGLY